MLKVEYTATTSIRYLENIADELSAVSGKKVYVKNSTLVFPENFAQGKFEFYNVNAGISICLIDCCFKEDILFIREPLKIYDFHILSFNISIDSAVRIRERGNKDICSGDWKGIFFSTSSTGVEWVAPKDVRVKIVTVLYTKDWLFKHYKIDYIPDNVPYAKELALDMPLQFSLDFDLKLLHMVQNILESPVPKNMQKLYYEGGIKKLIAYTIHRYIFMNVYSTKLKYIQVMKIMNITKKLEDQLDKPLPLMDELAKEYSMDRSSFAVLFKEIYGKSFTNYFHEVKMQRASELLQKGMNITEVSIVVGYQSLSHFISVFKEKFKVTPKVYQMVIKKINRPH